MASSDLRGISNCPVLRGTTRLRTFWLLLLDSCHPGGGSDYQTAKIGCIAASLDSATLHSALCWASGLTRLSSPRLSASDDSKLARVLKSQFEDFIQYAPLFSSSCFSFSSNGFPFFPDNLAGKGDYRTIEHRSPGCFFESVTNDTTPLPVFSAMFTMTRL